MKHIYKTFLLILILTLGLVGISSCSDDNDDVNIETYIKGKWCSYKAEISANNKTVNLKVSRTGEYSDFYYEFVFKDNNKVENSYYENVANQNSRWKTETDTYSIKGDVVTIYDGRNFMDLFVKGKSLYIRTAVNVENIGYATVFVYLRK